MAKLLKERRDVEGFPIKKKRQGRRMGREKGKKIAEESEEKIEPGYLGIPKSLGFSGYAARLGWD